MISILPGRPREWKSSASASVNLTLLSLMLLSCAASALAALSPRKSPSLARRRFAVTTCGDGPRRRPKPTPMMAQYHRLKAEAGGCLAVLPDGRFLRTVLRRCQGRRGDCLDIALTKRGADSGEPIPMCGVPVHAAEAYLARLIRAGHRVAIAEQIESPAEARKARGVEGAGRPRHRPAGHAGHADRGGLARIGRGQLARRGRRARATIGRSPRPTFRPGGSSWSRAGRASSTPSWRGSPRPRRSPPTRCRASRPRRARAGSTASPASAR